MTTKYAVRLPSDRKTVYSNGGGGGGEYPRIPPAGFLVVYTSYYIIYAYIIYVQRILEINLRKPKSQNIHHTRTVHNIQVHDTI